MIHKQEIMDLAREFSLGAETVEKDYVLGWLLAGIANHPNLFDQWVFKGGTCLKKCYFETYRFSEDLDYTLINTNHVDEKFLGNCFNKIASWVYDASGIEIPKESIRFEIYENSGGKTSIEGRVYYIGPLKRSGSPARIKLDLTTDELLVLPPVTQDVHHPYSDKPKTGMIAQCYDYAEVFAEKIRALSERARPRDLYDVIHLYRHTASTTKPVLILDTLIKKCAYKKIPVPTIQSFENHPKKDELNREWSNMLEHQLPLLPRMEEFWQELPNVFYWLHGNEEKTVKHAVPQLPSDQSIDYSWQPSSMIQPWHMSVPVELIRYAGANHLCLEILYDNKIRLIEPYALNRTIERNIVLKAIQRDINDWRSFRIDRIQSMTVKAIPFVPQYDITLTPFIQATPSQDNYMFECPICNKKFRRTKFDSKLRAHKNKDGLPCPARHGISV